MSDYRLRATMDTAQVEQGLKRIEQSVGKVNDAFAGLKSAIAGLAIGSFIQQSVNLAVRLDTLAQVTGISTANLRGFQQALSQAGGNSDQAGDAISDLVKNLGEAANGSKELVTAFGQVGVSFDDINRLPTEQVLGKVIQGLAGIQDEAKRSAIGMKIMGEAVKTVDFRSVAGNYGTFAAQSAQFAASASSAREAQQRMTQAIDKLRESVIIALKPVNDLIASLRSETINKAAKAIVDIGVAFAGLFIVTRVASGIRTAVDAFRLFRQGGMSVFGTTNDLVTGLRYLKDAFNISSAASVAAGTGFGIIGTTLKSLGGAVLRLAPIMAALYASFQVLDVIVTQLTGRDIGGWLDKVGINSRNAAIGVEYLGDALGDLLNLPTDLLGKILGIDNAVGLGTPLKMLTEQARQARIDAERMAQGAWRGRDAQDRAKYAEDQKKELQRAAELLKEQAKASKLLKEENWQYVQNMAIGLARQVEAIQHETRLVGMTEDQKEIENAINDNIVARLAAVKALEHEQRKLQIQLEFANELEAKGLREQIAGLGYRIAKTKEYYNGQEQGLTEAITKLQTARKIEEGRILQREALVKSINDEIARQQQLGDVLRGINDRRVEMRFETSLKGMSPLRQQIARINEEARKAATEAQNAFAATFEDKGYLDPEEAESLARGLEDIAKGFRGIADEQIKGLGVSQQYLNGFSNVSNENLRKVMEFQEEFKLGVKDSFKSYADDALDAAKQAKDGFATFTQGMEDAFVRFAQTGKLSFKDMANSILADLARIAVKRAIVFFGTKLFGIPGFAEGGDPPVGRPSIVGEKGPELFVPKSAGTIIPNSKLKGGGGEVGGFGQTTVNYNIQAVDAASFRSLVARDPSFIYAVTEQGRRSQPTRSR